MAVTSRTGPLHLFAARQGAADRLALITESEAWGLDRSGIGARGYLDIPREFGFKIYDLGSLGGPSTPIDPDALCRRDAPIKDPFAKLYCLKGDAC